ncbi:MAG TPA: DMT family transporter [Candidatus Binatia bacterium]|nr:DMT family transporter [Candidatus Binatia bacterium]
MSGRDRTAEGAGRRGFIDRYSAVLITAAAAMWAVDTFFRPALVSEGLSASQIVLGETLIISLCFIPVARRVARELRRASWRTWLVLAAIGVGPQAFATVLFTKSLTFAYSPGLSHQASLGITSEVYLLYFLQPVFGAVLAWIFLRERRRPVFWPLAAVALGGAALIAFSTNVAAPQVQLLAAGYVLGAVLLWAAGTVLGRYALTGISFASTSAMRFVLALPVLLVLMLTDPAAGGFGKYAPGQIPTFLGIALIPGLIAMVLYYRALSSTPASVSSFAELGYPAALFLIYTLPPHLVWRFGGFGLQLNPWMVVGAVMLVAAVVTLNYLMRRDVVRAPRPSVLRLVADRSSG